MLFEFLSVFTDSEPHSAAANMAIDEALLRSESLEDPLIRFYRWQRQSVSFGYFNRWNELSKYHGKWDPVRRWTGGGVVEHTGDQTYSLIIPAIRSGIGNEDLYREVHSAIAAIAGKAGLKAVLVQRKEGTTSTVCFEKAVVSDVQIGSKKIAGAAIRRHRQGVLLQGSVQAVELPLAGELPAHLANQFSGFKPRSDLWREAEKLSREKYGTREWLEKY